MEKKESIEKFWDWWQRHRTEFDALVTPESPFWDRALRQLQRLDGRLWFELSEPGNEDREFVITAEGHQDAFPLVGEIVEFSPKISGWRFIPLKPPMGFDFTTRYEGILFKPREMGFIPLKGRRGSNAVSLRIAIPNLGVASERQAYNAVAVILDTGLGERSAALDIQYFEIATPSERQLPEGYRELRKLPAYLKRRKKRSKRG